MKLKDILFYRLLRVINTKLSENRRKEYTSLIRACIAPEILFLIAINAFCGDIVIYKDYRNYLCSSGFLEHLPINDNFFYNINLLSVKIDKTLDGADPLIFNDKDDFMNTYSLLLNWLISMYIENLFKDNKDDTGNSKLKDRIIAMKNKKDISSIWGESLYIDKYIDGKYINKNIKNK